MAFNIPLILVGTGAGFLLGGPVGAAAGAAAGAALGKKPDLPPDAILVQTPAGPAVLTNPGIPQSVQAGADLVNHLIEDPLGTTLPFIPGAL